MLLLLRQHEPRHTHPDEGGAAWVEVPLVKVRDVEIGPDAWDIDDDLACAPHPTKGHAPAWVRYRHQAGCRACAFCSLSNACTREQHRMPGVEAARHYCGRHPKRVCGCRDKTPSRCTAGVWPTHARTRHSEEGKPWCLLVAATCLKQSGGAREWQAVVSITLCSGHVLETKRRCALVAGLVRGRRRP